MFGTVKAKYRSAHIIITGTHPAINGGGGRGGVTRGNTISNIVRTTIAAIALQPNILLLQDIFFFTTFYDIMLNIKELYREPRQLKKNGHTFISQRIYTLNLN